MDLFASIWFVALIAFALGTGLGFYLFKTLQSDDAKSRKLEDELEQTQHDFEIYKQSVTSHFNKTAELVNDLTQDYVKVYQHLAEGAGSFADQAQVNNQLGQQQANSLVSFINENEEKEQDVGPVEAPKDYAPPPDPNADNPATNSSADEDRKSA